MYNMPIKLKHSKEVEKAKKHSLPILALESTIIAHGMPYPENLEFALESETLCKKIGVTPATIAIIEGQICVGLEKKELEQISKSNKIKKVSVRELGIATSLRWSGATTVSSTMHIAKNSNIEVFSTGGIGGVHREADKSFDVSQDLSTLSKIPMVVVSSGAKSILDISKTIETLEALGVCLLGFNTNEFPSFYSRKSGYKSITEVSSVNEIANVFLNNEFLNLPCSTLVANPVPKENEIPQKKITSIINKIILDLKKNKISGKKVTPFLLERIHKETNGESLNTNISLALNNVHLGAKIARDLSGKRKTGANL